MFSSAGHSVGFALSSLCASSLLSACLAPSIGRHGPCEADPAPVGCGVGCNASSPCASGFYCSRYDTCTADCTAGGSECDGAEECSPNGQCISAGTGGEDGGSSDNGAGDAGSSGDDCPPVLVQLTPVVPDTILLIDRSGTMNDPLPDGDPTTVDPSHWGAMETALIGNGDGFLFQLQAGLNMGAALFNSNGGNLGGASCPLLTSVALSIDNAQAIADLVSQADAPVGDTPTGESVSGVSALFPADDKPHIIVLATDGLPDTCLVPDPDGVGQIPAENAVRAAHEDLGITTMVLAIGFAFSHPHFQRMANLGVGKPADDPDPAVLYSATSPGQLVDALQQIGRTARSCDIDIDGTVDLARAPEGSVTLNGELLDYGADADWIMMDADTLDLVGDACTAFKSAAPASLMGQFPCGSVVFE